jgi:hypothetical protein
MVGPVSPVSNMLLSSYVNTETRTSVVNSGGDTGRIDSTVFRTVYYQYDHGTISVRNVSSSSQTINILV